MTSLYVTPERLLIQCSELTSSSRIAIPAAKRSIFQTVALLLALVVPSTTLKAQSTPESPIKVHGGSTTFYTQDLKGWVKLPNTQNTFCTTLRASDANQVHVSGFYGMTSDFTRQQSKSGRVNVNPFDWRIEFMGHAPEEERQIRVQPQGIVLQASRLDCNDRRTGTPSLRISPLAGATFYSTDLLPTQRYHGNKRFRSTCTGESADLCERTAQIKVFPSSDPKNPKPPSLTLNCPDGACTVYIGNLQSISLAPTVRIEGGRTTPPIQ